MRLLLDTNRYRDLVDRDRAVTKRIEESTSTHLSLITIGELRAGFRRGTKRGQNESRLQAVLDLQGVGVIAIDDETTHYFAQVFDQLRRAGKPIPTNDMWIAAQALQHNLLLDTRDSHFAWIEGVRLVGDG